MFRFSKAVELFLAGWGRWIVGEAGLGLGGQRWGPTDHSMYIPVTKAEEADGGPRSPLIPPTPALGFYRGPYRYCQGRESRHIPVR